MLIHSLQIESILLIPGVPRKSETALYYSVFVRILKEEYGIAYEY
jgi:hypothetical protein